MLHRRRVRCRSWPGRGSRTSSSADRRRTRSSATPAQQLGRDQVLEVADRLVLGPDPSVVGDRRALAGHPHPLQVGVDLDPSSDHRGVHRVVVGVQPDVVVPRQPGRAAPTGLRGDRRQRQHRRPVRADPVGRGAAEHPLAAAVGQREPPGELGVEVLGSGEGAAGQEGGLQVVVEPLDHPLGLRVGRLADVDPARPAPRGTPGSPRSARLRRARHRPTAPSPSQTSNRGTAPRFAKQLPPAGIEVLGLPGRHQHRGHPTGVAADHGQHRQLPRGPGLAEADRQLDVGEPEVALGNLSGLIGGPRRRVRRQVDRPQLD